MYRFRGGWLTKDLYGAVPTVINTGGITWLFRDNFDTAQAAGAINGTPSEPSGHTRTMTDSVPNAVITGGQYKVTAVAGVRDPWLRYATGWARVAGRMLRADLYIDQVSTNNLYTGFATTLVTPAAANHLGAYFGNALMGVGGGASNIGSYTLGNILVEAVILRSTGYFVIIDSKLKYIFRADATATLYPSFAGIVADPSLDLRIDNLGIADLPLTNPALYPTPTLSDTFSVPPIVDYGDNALHGTPVNVGLNGSEGKYNGTSSSTNVLSSGFNSLFSGAAGTVIIRINPAVPATTAYCCEFYVDVDNRVSMYLLGGGTALTVGHTGAGTPKTDAVNVVIDGLYHTFGGTWSIANDQVLAYYDGSTPGSPGTGLGVYAGSLTYARVGSRYSGIAGVSGSIQDTIIANTVASPAQMATIHTALAAGTLSKATLDGIFGAGHYVWYKHNEQYQSNGLAHVETNTVQALDAGGNALNGTHRNVKLSGSYGTYDPALLSYTDIYSAGLNTLFDELKGTLVARCKVASGQTFADGVLRGIVRFGADSNNVVDIRKAVSANYLAFIYTAGGTSKVVNKSNFTETGWFTPGLTWDKAGDAMKAYYNGAQEGSTQTGLGVWAGALAGGATALGALNNTPTGSWDGSIGDVIFSNVVATPTQMADLHTYLTAGTLTADILNTMFGANNWAWYKLDEAVTYPTALPWNGSGHFHNAGGKAYISPALDPNMIDVGARTFDVGTYSWDAYGANLVENDAGELKTTYVDTANGSVVLMKNTEDLNADPTVGEFYYWSTEARVNAGGSVTLQFYNGTSAYSYKALTETTLVQAYLTTRMMSATGGYSRITNMGAGEIVWLDNQAFQHIPFTQCLRAVAPASAGEPYQSVKMTITANTQAGGVINLDSYTTPLYGIHWWVDRGDGKLYARKLVNGVWQADSIAGVAVTYSAGAYGEIRRIGNEVYVFYNGAFVATFDAADVPTTNTLQALFATDSGSYFESDTSYPTNGYDFTLYQ